MTDPTPNDLPMTTPLSPAAQAVLDAYGHCLGSYEAQVNTIRPGATRLAAALCAVADQAIPMTKTPWGSTLVPVLTSQESRERILAIATELEAVPNG